MPLAQKLKHQNERDLLILVGRAGRRLSESFYTKPFRHERVVVLTPGFGQVNATLLQSKRTSLEEGPWEVYLVKHSVGMLWEKGAYTKKLKV